MKIFISHSSADKIIIDDFVGKILQLGLGIQEEDIFCTSIQGMDIRTGEDFVSAIKDKLLEAKVVIVVLSNNYKESEICLNEMGAAWILGKKTYPMIIEPLKYSEVGFMHITKQIVKLCSSDDLDNFKESIEDELEMVSAKTSTWNRNKSNFLRELSRKPIVETEKSKEPKIITRSGISETSIQILNSINNAPAHTNTVYGIHLDTRLQEGMIELHISKLLNDGYVKLHGSYFKLSTKGKQTLFGHSL